jgi:hypothetical protein
MPAISNLMRLTSLTITPGTPWNVDCQVGPFPPTWLAALRDAYHRRPEIKRDWSLPTRGLVELLTGLDPAIVNVSSDPASDRFIVASRQEPTPSCWPPGSPPGPPPVSPPRGATPTAALCQPCDFDFHTETINLLDYHVRPNATAAGASQMFTLLPTFLAQTVWPQSS